MGEIVLQSVDSVHLIQDTDQWSAYVYIVMNFGVATMCWE
jgi:hypothetical protein